MARAVRTAEEHGGDEMVAVAGNHDGVRDGRSQAARSRCARGKRGRSGGGAGALVVVDPPLRLIRARAGARRRWRGGRGRRRKRGRRCRRRRRRRRCSLTGEALGRILADPLARHAAAAVTIVHACAIFFALARRRRRVIKDACEAAVCPLARRSTAAARIVHARVPETSARRLECGFALGHATGERAEPLARRVVATASRGAKAPVADSAALADSSAGGAPDRDGERDEDGGLHGRNSCCTFCV